MHLAFHARTFEQADALLVHLRHGVREAEADGTDPAGSHATKGRLTEGSHDTFYQDALPIEAHPLTNALVLQRLSDR